MIFVTVGTQLPFSRLVRAVDNWAQAHPDVEVRGQIGAVGPNGYRPKHIAAKEFLDPATYMKTFRSARLVVAHAGTGSLLKANETGTPILVMPRKASLGEHRNDHQMATASHFESRPGMNVVYEEADVAAAIDALLNRAPEVPSLGEADAELIADIRSTIFPKLG